MTEIDAYPIEAPRRLQFGWLLPAFIKPRRTLAKVVESSSGTWLTPLLILTLVAILGILIAGPIRLAAAQNAPQELPLDFEFWMPEQQQRYQEALSASSGPVFTHVLPGVAALAEIWIGWVLFGAVLHLVMTLGGSRTSMTTVLNIVAWASVPLIIRLIVRGVSMLSTHQLVVSPGLSGFGPQTGGVLSNYAGAILPMVDIYLVWMIVLIIIGLRPLPGVSTPKAISSVLITTVIVLVLMAIPGFLSAQLGGMSVTRPFFFF